MKLSDQALTCIMVALQKSIMEQADIVPVLKSFDMKQENDEIYVLNPPKSLTMKNTEE